MEEQNIPQEPQENNNTLSKKELREKAKAEAEEKAKKKEKDKRNILITILVFAILLFLIVGFRAYLSNLLPEQQMQKAKKYYSEGQYEKALKLFDSVANALPHDYEPIYYKALTLSKLPATTENQKELYEIAWLDDCDEANEVAEKALSLLRWKLNKEIGSNYTDNILYEDKLIRWNKSEPITYSIKSQGQVPNNYYNDVRQAFNNWSQALNKNIEFKEENSENAKIQIVFTDNISDNVINNQNSGDVKPVINDSKLMRMDVKLKRVDTAGNPYKDEQLISLAQHEIGHALGLFGHSANYNDTMYFERDTINPQTEYQGISTRDVNTLKALYNMIPDVVDVPLSPAEMKNMYFHNILTYYPGENFELDIQKTLSQIKNSQESVVLWVNLAIEYGYRGQYERSNYILTKLFPLITNDFGNQFVVLYNMAVNYYKMRNYTTAQKYLNAATNIDDDKDTQTLEAFLDYKFGRTELAKNKLILLNKAYPQDIEIALKLANVYYRLNDIEKENEVIDNIILNNASAMSDRRIAKYRPFGTKLNINKQETRSIKDLENGK